MPRLVLHVTYVARPGMRERFVKEAEESGVLEKIRLEEGCLGYEYFYSVEDEERILLVEKWTSEDCQKKHLGQPHMEALKEIKERYIEKTELEVL